ncbi:MAG: glycosyltransferase family 4 protein [Gammaproteobacteria bacterium]|nr:glycosyltransferase family 4 protein [Gammaproteobacteria bacterium]
MACGEFREWFKQMKKIIFVNRFFYPDQSATSQILTDLLRNIDAPVNAELHVITSRSAYLNDAKFAASEKLNNIFIHRVWTTNFGRSKLAGRAIDYLSFYLFTFLSLFKLVSKDDIVIAKTDPPVISFVVYIVTSIKKAHLINWLQDLFPDVAGELGVIDAESLLFRILNKIKYASLAAAEVNVVIGEKMGALLAAQGINKNKIEVIRNWSINENVNYIPKEQNHLINDWGLTDKFVVSYSGNFGWAHEYEPIKRLITDFVGDDVVFLFIGGGKHYDDLKEYADTSSIRNVIFKPYQDTKDLNYSLSVADLHLVSLNPSLEGLIVPSKFYGIASIGVPMLFLGDNDGEIAQVIKSKKCGFIISPSNYDEIVAVIHEIKNDKDKLTTISKNLTGLYRSEYKPVVAYKKWEEILTRY